MVLFLLRGSGDIVSGAIRKVSILRMWRPMDFGILDRKAREEVGMWRVGQVAKAGAVKIFRLTLNPKP